MNATALPAAALEHAPERLGEAHVGVADHQLDPREASLYQGLLEVCPSRARRHGLITVGCAGTAPPRCHPTLPIRLPPPI